MNRRDAIKNASLALGFTVSGSALMTFMSACQSQPAIDPNFSPQVLNTKQLEFIRALGDIILPATETPGAADLELEKFFDKMLAGLYDEKGRTSFLEGLFKLNESCQQDMGGAFVKLSIEKQTEFVRKQEELPMPSQASLWGSMLGGNQEIPFYRQFKSSLLWGYFTSKEIGTEVLDYNPVPGQFQACIPVTEETRIDPL